MNEELREGMNKGRACLSSCAATTAVQMMQRAVMTVLGSIALSQLDA